MKNKENLIIAGIIALIVIFFGTRSYLSIEKTNSKLPTVESQMKNREKYKPPATHKTVKKEPTLFVFSSDFYDIEYLNGGMVTRKEMTYHLLDFKKQIVIQTSFMNGEKVSVTYPFKDMYIERGVLASTYVMRVNTLGINEIWFSPDVPNLGYDYEDGTRIACYDLNLLKSE